MKGRERPLTQSSFSSFLVKRDHELRKRAFHQFYSEFRDHQLRWPRHLHTPSRQMSSTREQEHYSSALEAALIPRRCARCGLRAD